ncbi:MAG: SDR family oxidoreductase [Candidatus Omnitrophica bacterium]|nr:SDR family oxidoreductase [Candidatus Omnitrophota bacterium]
MFDLLVVGAGYLGGALARFYASQGMKVAGLVKTESSSRKLSASGIIPFVIDLTQVESCASLPEANKIFISISSGKRTASEEEYKAVYLQGLENVLRHLQAPKKIRQIIYVSSTGVYGEHEGNWVDETTPERPDSRRAEILLEAEEKLLQSGFPVIVFRLGGIYGPGRNRIQSAEEGTWRMKENPNSYINLIHRDDIVGAAELLFNHGKSGEIYLGVDDEPVRQTELYQWLAGRLGTVPPGSTVPSGAIGKRCRNQKLKHLGMKFIYPNFRVGYEALLESKKAKSDSH